VRKISVNLTKLRELGEFLARNWSSRHKIVLSIGTSDEIPHVELNQNKIVMPTLARMKMFRGVSLYDKYRLWRFALFHESCHIRHDSESVYYEARRILEELFREKYRAGVYWPFSDFFRSVFNVVEDYRVEELGVREYQGMLTEKLFAKAVYRKKLRVPRNDVEIFAQLLLVDKVQGDIEIPEYVREAVRHVKENVMKDPAKTVAEATIMLLSKYHDYYAAKIELARYKFEEDPLVALIDCSRKRIQRGELEEEAREIIGEENTSSTCKPDNARIDVKMVMRGTKAVRGEFKQISMFERRTEREFEGEAITKDVNDPGDYAHVYDPSLSQKLINSLTRIKRKFLEVADRTGEQFDVEEYISSRGHRPFIREEPSKVGGYEVIILVDLSRSIFGYDEMYKRALMAIGDALDYLKVSFSVYGFRGDVDPYACEPDHLYLPRFKGFNEKWGRSVRERIASAVCSGLTPTGTILERVLPIALKRKGKVITMLVTDGVPEPHEELEKAREMVKLYKRHGIKIVAFGFGHDSDQAVSISENLKSLGILRSFAVSDLNKLPEKLVTTLLNEMD